MDMCGSLFILYTDQKADVFGALGEIMVWHPTHPRASSWDAHG